jgi:Na+-transporting NADH:ubiquinone oxidoreductase subunit NqrF
MALNVGDAKLVFVVGGRGVKFMNSHFMFINFESGGRLAKVCHMLRGFYEEKVPHIEDSFSKLMTRAMTAMLHQKKVTKVTTTLQSLDTHRGS